MINIGLVAILAMSKWLVPCAGFSARSALLRSRALMLSSFSDGDSDGDGDGALIFEFVYVNHPTRPTYIFFQIFFGGMGW